MTSLAQALLVPQAIRAHAARPCLSYRFSFDPALAGLGCMRVYDTPTPQVYNSHESWSLLKHSQLCKQSVEALVRTVTSSLVWGLTHPKSSFTRDPPYYAGGLGGSLTSTRQNLHLIMAGSDTSYRAPCFLLFSLCGSFWGGVKFEVK